MRREYKLCDGHQEDEDAFRAVRRSRPSGQRQRVSVGITIKSHHFANFSFEQINSSPWHSQSNGMVGSAVMTTKTIYK